MNIALFITFMFLHIAFGLALAFFVFHYATKTEHKSIKKLGFIVGYLLIILAILSMFFSVVFIAKSPYYMHEKIMKQGMPMMQKQQEDKNTKKINFKQIKKSGKGCPVETKKEAEKELQQGRKTGAACHADMKESQKVKK